MFVAVLYGLENQRNVIIDVSLANLVAHQMFDHNLSVSSGNFRLNVVEKSEGLD